MHLSCSKITKKWFSEQNISLLDCPPQSPDLNPIKNAWNYLDQRARLRLEEFSNADGLFKILEDEAKNRSYVH